MMKKPFIYLILLATALISAGFIYTFFNNDRNSKATDNTNNTQQTACYLDENRQNLIKELSIGEMAALKPAQKAIYLNDITVENNVGDRLTLDEIAQGRMSLVNLWASWCAPCREEMPTLDQLQADKGGDEFTLIAINIDTGNQDASRTFLQDINAQNITYYQDSTLTVFNRFKKMGLTLGLPATVLIDEKGCLLASMAGPAHWSSNEAYQLIDALITSP